VRLRTGDLRGAAEAYEASLRLEADDVGACLGLVEVLLRQGRSDDALALARRALALAPQDPNALQSLARVHFSRGEFAEAVPLLEQVSRQGETRFTTDYLLAVCLQQTGRELEALEVLERAVARDDGSDPRASAEVHARRVHLLAKHGRRADARAALTEALARHPTYGPLQELARELAGAR